MSSTRNALLLAALLLQFPTNASPVPELRPGGLGPKDTSSGESTEGVGCTIITYIFPAPTSSSITFVESFLPSISSSISSEATSTSVEVIGVETTTLTTTSSAPTTLATITASSSASARFTTSSFSAVIPIATSTSIPTVARLPSTGTSTNLPLTNNSLKFVALGRGIQNYTCKGINATPVALGAVAVLFDYTSLASTNETELHTLPPTAANITFAPLPLNATPASLPGLPEATVLGHHFFAADGTPTFNLTGALAADGVGNMVLSSAKTASVDAPAGSALGPDGTGAVAWLQLEAKTNVVAEASVGVKEVYRVETAGGNPEAVCSSVGVMTIDYAAEYWFFE